MRLPRKSKAAGDVDVSAFSDLAFLLIIFFVLTTTFVQRMGIATTIPASTTDPERKPEHQIPLLTLTQDRMIFDEVEVDFETLRSRLRELQLSRRPDDERAIILECAPEVGYERYFQAVSAISGAGGILALMEAAEGQRR